VTRCPRARDDWHRDIQSQARDKRRVAGLIGDRREQDVVIVGGGTAAMNELFTQAGRGGRSGGSSKADCDRGLLPIRKQRERLALNAVVSPFFQARSRSRTFLTCRRVAVFASRRSASPPLRSRRPHVCLSKQLIMCCRARDNDNVLAWRSRSSQRVVHGRLANLDSPIASPIAFLGRLARNQQLHLKAVACGNNPAQTRRGAITGQRPGHREYLRLRGSAARHWAERKMRRAKNASCGRTSSLLLWGG